jgi:hypothetical protein
MSEELKAKINSLKKKSLLTDKGKIKTPEDSEIKKRLEKAKESDLNTSPRGLTIDIPERLQKKETTIDKVKMAKGGRVQLRGGGICKRGMNKKAIGRNS